jgi:hypothetical protein
MARCGARAYASQRHLPGLGEGVITTSIDRLPNTTMALLLCGSSESISTARHYYDSRWGTGFHGGTTSILGCDSRRGCGLGFYSLAKIIWWTNSAIPDRVRCARFDRSEDGDCARAVPHGSVQAHELRGDDTWQWAPCGGDHASASIWVRRVWSLGQAGLSNGEVARGYR